MSTPIFSISRFHCGCIYRRITDRIFFCLSHGAILTAEETIRLPQGMTKPPLRGLVMSEYFPGQPKLLQSTDGNSIHQKVKVMDPGQREWMEEVDETGLCPACFIDEGDTCSSGIATCECRQERCPYRWCGRTDGLHAWWSLHAAGLTEKLSGIDDRDIFSMGPAQDLYEELEELLAAERDFMFEEEARRKAEEMTSLKWRMPPWLDAMHRANGQPGFLQAMARIRVVETADERRMQHQEE